MDSIEVSARIGALVVQAAAAAGVPAALLQRDTGFDLARAADPDARIPLAQEEALWNEAAARTGDDAFGIHAAEALKPGALDVLDYAVRTAPTLRASLERLARYNRLLHDVAVFTLIDRGEVLRIEHAFHAAAVPCRHAAEFTLASLVVVGSQMNGAPIRPLLVEFRHQEPASVREHQRLFGLKPRFSAAVNAIEFAAADVDRPTLSADPALFNVIQRHAEALLAARPEPTETTSRRVRRMLGESLGQGEITLAEMAARLHMSPRSLQRRLADEGISFDGVLDELRRELALRYLADPKIAIGEVAYLLGYSEPSAFHRAFKRWTGITPSEARRSAA